MTPDLFTLSDPNFLILIGALGALLLTWSISVRRPR